MIFLDFFDFDMFVNLAMCGTKSEVRRLQMLALQRLLILKSAGLAGSAGQSAGPVGWSSRSSAGNLLNAFSWSSRLVQSTLIAGNTAINAVNPRALIDLN